MHAGLTPLLILCNETSAPEQGPAWACTVHMKGWPETATPVVHCMSRLPQTALAGGAGRRRMAQ